MNYGVFQKSSWWEQALFPVLWSYGHSFPLIITGGSLLVWGSWLKQQISILLNTQRGSSADLEHFLRIALFFPILYPSSLDHPELSASFFFNLRSLAASALIATTWALSRQAVSQFRKLHGSLHLFSILGNLWPSLLCIHDSLIHFRHPNRNYMFKKHF